MPDDRRLEHRDAPDAIIAEAEITSGVALSLGDDPTPLVQAELELTGRLYGTLILGIEVALAREISTMLAEAADVAEDDLARYLDTGDPRE